MHKIHFLFMLNLNALNKEKDSPPSWSGGVATQNYVTAQ